MPASFEFIAPPVLAAAEFDRADHVRKDPERLTRGWVEAHVILVDHRARYPVTESGQLRWTPAVELGAEPVPGAVFLGVGADGTDRWALRVDELAGPAADARTGAHRLHPDDAGLLATALGVLNWHRTAGFSPVDGNRLDAVQGGWLLRDPHSGAEEYPRTDPAVIMVIHDGADHVLLGRQSVWPDRWFSTLAGFVEPGESLEQCVRREAFEEAGVQVHSPQYVGSQPWPFPRSLMLGFEAFADRSAPLALRDGELSDARWFHRDEVRDALDRSAEWGTGDDRSPLLLPGSISIARSLLDGWARAGS